VIVAREFTGKECRNIIQNFMTSFEDIKSKEDLPISKIHDVYCCYLEHEDIIFVSVLHQDAFLTTIFGLLELIKQTLYHAFQKTLHAEKIRQNFSLVLLIIDQAIDYGYPALTEPALLTSIMEKTNILNKAQEIISGLSTKSITEKIEVSIAELNTNENSLWRPSKGISHYTNECYIDLFEYLECELDRACNVVWSQVTGELKVNAKLSGKPDLLVYMKLDSELADYTLHPCVIDRKKRFEDENILYFTPTDCEFTLLEYTVKNFPITLPFYIHPEISILNGSYKIDLRVESMMVRGEYLDIREFKVEIHFPCETSNPSISTNMGTFVFNNKNNRGKWSIESIVSKFGYVLNGTMHVSDEQKALNKHVILDISFSIGGFSFSGTKVEKVMVKGESYNAFKGARCISKSYSVEMRI